MCPITNCQLLNAGCKTKYTGVDLIMSSASPWAITVGDSAQPGQVSKVCISCTNGIKAETLDNYSVTQTGSCLQVLSTGKKLQVTTLNWSASPTPVAIGAGWSTFIGNSKPELCGITSCELLHSDCKTLLHGPDLPITV